MIFFNRKISMFFMLAATLSLFSAGHSKEEQKAGHSKEEQKNETPPVDFQKVSEAFGHLIGKHIDSLGFEFDLSHVIKGISDAVAGKESPLSEADCIQKVSEVQEQAFQRQADVLSCIEAAASISPAVSLSAAVAALPKGSSDVVAFLDEAAEEDRHNY